MLRGKPSLSKADLAPTTDPTPRAAEFLLACQGPDGRFHADRGVREGDPAPEAGKDDALTGLSVLVLLDVADPTGDTRVAKAARAALSSVAAGQRASDGALSIPDGGRPADPEAQALLAWALTAGYAHTAEPSWRPKVAPAIRHLVSMVDPAGGWRAPGGTLADHLLVTLWAVGALHEAMPLEKTVPDDVPLDDLLESAGAWAAGLLAREVERLPAGAHCAWSLLARFAGEDADPVEPETALRPLSATDPLAFACDHLAILWGTVHRFLGGDKEAWRRWESAAVLPALLRQHAEGPAAGSWDPGDDLSRRRGRAWSTAVEAMAWLVIRVDYRAPKTD